jgi:hypothetical protein
MTPPAVGVHSGTLYAHPSDSRHTSTLGMARGLIPKALAVGDRLVTSASMVRRSLLNNEDFSIYYLVFLSADLKPASATTLILEEEP